MGSSSQRRDARDRVAAYHQMCLDELVGHVAKAIDGYRAGDLDAQGVDELIHQYHRAAQELWKFCWAGGGASHLGFVADLIEQQIVEARITDWWQRGAPRQR